jgi:N-acetylglucosaminyldiphosphoundecaprenol N-acetyl-beta-D-mannosaminyltransferase
LLERHPNLQIVGTYCPPMGFEKDDAENRRIVDMIREASPDIVFVGLGSPKQEHWIDAHMEQYGAPVSIGIGITFSFICGDVRRAPRLLQKIGLEWAWRLACEPRRLWRRYLLRGAQFVPIVLSDLRRRRRGDESLSAPRRPEPEAPRTPQPISPSTQVVTSQQNAE